MTTVRVEVEQGEATSTYLNVEQIVRADFYTTGARNLAYAMVHMPDGNTESGCSLPHSAQ
jgi:hypothetical protein